jgi:hypothetical protein
MAWRLLRLQNLRPALGFILREKTGAGEFHMHASLVVVGVIIVLVIVIHIVFRVIKFTLAVFLLGLAFLAVVYVFQHYLGIDLLAAMGLGAGP